MKKFTTKNKLGFSLLELMVVVAIIGVLATFAVPRFNIFRARARQGEAKSNLGVIFTLQEAFKIDKEKYYNGVGGANGWGGDHMNSGVTADDNYVGYKGSGSDVCKANRLGFRLANCGAARYRYWIASANEDTFLAQAYALSDANARIFPGCPGNGAVGAVNATKTSLGGEPACAHDGHVAPNVGGDGFCLDEDRVVYNYRDIVLDPLCDE